MNAAKYTQGFAARVEHALSVMCNPQWRDFDASTIAAAREILKTARALGYVGCQPPALRSEELVRMELRRLFDGGNVAEVLS